MRSPQLILKNPDNTLPDWLILVEPCIWQMGDRYCTYTTDLEIEEAIASLTQLGFEVWAKEHWNMGWISERL